MFDERMRLVKDNLFDPLGRILSAIPPWRFSVLGLIIGIASGVALWQQLYFLGFVLWFFNRFFDGLDGVVARQHNLQSDFGGYLDTMIDHVVYAVIPVSLALGRPSPANILALIFLLSTFYVNGASWMYLSAILEKKRRKRGEDQLTTVNMPAGIIAGVETIIFFTAFMFFPSYLAWLFGLMSILVIATIIQRLVWAQRHLS